VIHSDSFPNSWKSDWETTWVSRTLCTRVSSCVYSILAICTSSPPLSRPLLREGLHSGARYQLAERDRRIFEINSRPKINSHEEESPPPPQQVVTPYPEDKTFQPSFIPSLSFILFLGSFPGLSIPLSCLLTLFSAPLASLLFSIRKRSYPYSWSLRANRTQRRLYALQSVS